MRGCLAYPIIHPAFANDKITEYCYDSDQVLGEYDYNSVSEDYELARKFVYGPGIDEPICMIDVADNNAVYYYHFDGLGSVAALSDVNSVIVEQYSYDVFGEPNTTSSVRNPYMFTGRRYDFETGIYYYRARYYNSSIGRFLQTDPIGYVDGLNMYAYVRNNPVTNIDPFGLDAISGWNPRTPPDYYVPLCCKKHSPGLAEMLGISVIECANMVMGETWKGWRFPMLIYGGIVGIGTPAIGTGLAYGTAGQYAFALSLCYKGAYCEEWGRRDWCGRCK